MNEERIKELFSNEEYVKGLFELGSYEKAADKLKEDGIEVSADDLKQAVDFIKKKESGELNDEDLEKVAGGSLLMIGGFLGYVAVMGGLSVGGVLIREKCC